MGVVGIGWGVCPVGLMIIRTNPNKAKARMYLASRNREWGKLKGLPSLFPPNRPRPSITLHPFVYNLDLLRQKPVGIMEHLMNLLL